MTVYLILITAVAAACAPGLLMLWLERRDGGHERDHSDE